MLNPDPAPNFRVLVQITLIRPLRLLFTEPEHKLLGFALAAPSLTAGKICKNLTRAIVLTHYSSRALFLSYKTG